jgi:isopentenyl diphosphate isomerase/L-lactate dehydrogenase-like FMN-dependent dehydrogenase
MSKSRKSLVPTLAPEPRFLCTTELIAAARRRLADPLWDFVCGGAETETTVARNRVALDRVAFRPRIARDVSATDTRSAFLGSGQRLPVFLAPLGGLGELDPNAGLAVARAAARFGCCAMLSSVGDVEVEALAEAADGQFIYQLYVHGDVRWTRKLAQRAADAGSRALCLTLDTAVLGRRDGGLVARYSPPGRPLGGLRAGEEHAQRVDWKFIDRLRRGLSVPLILKGIATAEDAVLALEHGIEVIYVSNHGGRQLDYGRGAMDILAEVVSAVRGKATILVDGGFMRGSDVLKGIAMGAHAVGLGRLQALALAAAGEDGLVRLLELLETEIAVNMKLLGVNAYAELDGSFLQPAQPVAPAHVLSAFPLLARAYPDLFGVEGR